MEDLPPGFRFYPTEEELISFYLRNMLEGKGPPMDQVIPVVDIYDHSPWFLPQYAGVRCRGDPEQWFFFSLMQEKAARGGRPNRLTSEGFWKATGSPGYVYSSDNRVIGMKRTMVFYQGRAPNGTKTQWKMNEYIAIDAAEASSSSAAPKLRPELSLCRVYLKSKTLRSFDRRPPPPVVGIVEGVARRPRHRRHGNEEKEEEETKPHVDHPLRDQKSSSHEDSTSSGEHANNTSSQTVEINSLDIDNMFIDNEPWWDLEKVHLE